jgi:hypothetical protein
MASFKARPLPKQTDTFTPAAMKERRVREEKERQEFRTKVEAFYQRPELQSKWEKARDILLVKYSSGNKWKQFNAKLIEKYGNEFETFSPSNSENIIETSNDGRVACSFCERRFVLSRLVQHENICANLKNKNIKRKVVRDKEQVRRTGNEDHHYYEEEEIGEEIKVAHAAAEFKKKMSNMSEIEQLEYQLSQMKRLQSLKN